MNINFNEFKIGRKQQSGMMSVYPLLAADVDTPMASFNDINFIGTYDYGSMIFKNNSDKPFIIPTGYSIITKQVAQDHGLPFATLISPHHQKFVETACCIQQHQGGLMKQEKITDFHILPLYVRKKHFQEYIKPEKGINNNILRTDFCNDFARLWKIISEFQKGLVKESSAHLVYFVDKFMDKLVQFTAEFEAVEGQRGAIIMLNNKVVGIEVTPTQEYWRIVWNSLIRDCYGSEVIRLTMNNLVEEFKEFQNNDLDLSNCTSIYEIENAIEKYYNNESDKASKILNDLSLKDTYNVPKGNSLIKINSENGLNYNIFKIKDSEIYGESYDKDGKMVYCSILF